jgi:putative ABC transport system substrate-binding protein
MSGPVAQAQQSKKVSRIGFLSYGSVEIEQISLAAFRRKLRELGYSEGQNIVIESRFAV